MGKEEAEGLFEELILVHKILLQSQEDSGRFLPGAAAHSRLSRQLQGLLNKILLVLLVLWVSPISDSRRAPKSLMSL